MRLILNSYLTVTGYQNKHENYSELTENIRVFSKYFVRILAGKLGEWRYSNMIWDALYISGDVPQRLSQGGYGENPPYDK